MIELKKITQEDLKKILDKHKLWFEMKIEEICDDQEGCRANLSNTDLSQANLSGMNLYGADLSNANLSNANLSNTDLTYADLRGANLLNTDLRGSNFHKAYSYGAKIVEGKVEC